MNYNIKYIYRHMICLKKKLTRMMLYNNIGSYILS